MDFRRQRRKRGKLKIKADLEDAGNECGEGRSVGTDSKATEVSQRDMVE